MPILPQDIPLAIRPAGQFSVTGLDLSLVTASAVTSIILSFLPASRNISFAQHPVRTSLSICTAFLAAFAAFCILLLSVILGWRREISLDALATVLFGLAAALVRIPEVLKHSNTLRNLIHRPSLCVAPHEFRYIRYGRSEPTTLFFKRWSKGFGGPGPNSNQGAINGMSIRCLPCKTSQPTCVALRKCFAAVLQKQQKESLGAWRRTGCSCRGMCFTHCKTGAEKVNEDSNWGGIRIGRSRHFVMLRDTDGGLTSTWWNAVLSEMHFALDPFRLKLNDGERVLNAFVLISDILSIGELVAKHRAAYIANEWVNNYALVAAKRTSVGVTCCRILKELGLHLWYNYPEIDMQNMDIPIDSLLNLNQLSTKAFGVLFFVLAEKSDMFGNKQRISAKRAPQKRRRSGQDILDAIYAAGNKPDEEFRKTCKEEVDSWLKDWGCAPDSLEDEEIIAKELREKHPQLPVEEDRERATPAARETCECCQHCRYCQPQRQNSEGSVLGESGFPLNGR